MTNNARDWDIPAQALTYSVFVSLAGTNLPTIDARRRHQLDADVAQSGLTNLITTIVTDNGVPAKNATNILVVVVGGILRFPTPMPCLRKQSRAPVLC